MRALKRAVRVSLLPTMVVLTWWWTTSTQDHIYFPPPDAIAASVAEWFPQGWHSDLLPTIQNIVVGYLIATVVGVGLGIAIGTSRVLSALLDPLCEFVRAIPTPAVVPLLLVLFGFNDQTRIFIVVLGAIWPILLGAIDGTRGIDPRHHDLADVFQLSSARRFWRITLPGASVSILSGMRTALSAAVITIVISEMIGSSAGLGHYVIESQRLFNIPAVWAGTLLLGLLGFILNLLFERLQRRLLHWQTTS